MSDERKEDERRIQAERAARMLRVEAEARALLRREPKTPRPVPPTQVKR